MEDPTEVHAEIRRRNPELTPAKMNFSHQALKQGSFLNGDPAKGEAAGRLSEARWRFQFDTLKKLGVLRGRFDPATAWTGEYCNDPKPTATPRP